MMVPFRKGGKRWDSTLIFLGATILLTRGFGCTKVSEGCKFCYAEKWDGRYFAGEHWGPGSPRKITSAANWKLPRKWNRLAAEAGERRRVFCASLADVFDDEGPDVARARLWSLIEECTNLDWLLLTKRPQNIKAYVPDAWLVKPLFNVWYGTSVESDKVTVRIPLLADVPAAIRFLSVEPMIGPVDYTDGFGEIDWAIYGGESHDSPLMARELKLDWVRDGIAACRRYGVAPFVKQLGSRYAYDNKLADSKGGEPDEWPEDLRVREFPSKRRVEQENDSIL